VSAARESSGATRESLYIGTEFYRALAEQFADWRREERLVRDPALLDSVHAFLAREARLLDENRFEEWLALFAPECAYWVPGAPGATDPLKEIAVCFDDRRQLEGRIYRLRTGHAWSQVPPSRTVRLVSNVEVFSAAEPDLYMVRSVFLTTEMRAGDTRTLAGWCGHRLARSGGGWRILVKQVNLLNCDQNLRNPSFIL
jgi:benzoate/toluate 1,2-dioxygenase beta subunit